MILCRISHRPWINSHDRHVDIAIVHIAVTQTKLPPDFLYLLFREADPYPRGRKIEWKAILPGS